MYFQKSVEDRGGRNNDVNGIPLLQEAHGDEDAWQGLSAKYAESHWMCFSPHSSADTGGIAFVVRCLVFFCAVEAPPIDVLFGDFCCNYIT